MTSTLIGINAGITAFISITGAFGNFIIIYAFANVKALRNTNNVFLLQLAIVDLMKSIMILPVKAYNQFTDQQSMHNLYCQPSGFISTITFVQSALLLAAIAVVRYFKIVKSAKFRNCFTKKRTVYYSVAIFLATALLGMLPLVNVGEYEFSKYHGICFTKWSTKNLVFRTLFYIYIIAGAYPVLIFCYARIFIKIRKHQFVVTANIDKSREELRNMEKVHEPHLDIKHVETGFKSPVIRNKQSSENTDGSKAIDNKTSGCKKGETERRESRSIHKEIKVTKVMFTVVIAYSFCWLPALIVTILRLSDAVPIDGGVLYFIVTLVDLKVFLNPLIYGLWNRQYRKGIKDLFMKKYLQERSSSTPSDANVPAGSC